MTDEQYKLIYKMAEKLTPVIIENKGLTLDQITRLITATLCQAYNQALHDIEDEPGMESNRERAQKTLFRFLSTRGITWSQHQKEDFVRSLHIELNKSQVRGRHEAEQIVESG